MVWVKEQVQESMIQRPINLARLLIIVIWSNHNIEKCKSKKADKTVVQLLIIGELVLATGCVSPIE